MKGEIDAAVKFLIKLIKQNSSLNEEVLIKFEACLRLFLMQKFNNHWHPERPWQGQGYRCLRVNGKDRNDPTIAKAALECGLKYSDLKLPLELTLWVDPDEVCCRFGEHKGSYCTVASFKESEKENYKDVDLLKIPKPNPTSTSPSEKTMKERTKIENSSKPSFSVGKTQSSRKENIAPLRERIPSYHNQNSYVSKERKLRASYGSPMVNRVNGKSIGGSFPYLHKEYPVNMFPLRPNGVPLYNQNENISPCYRSSWVSYPTSVSPPHPTFASNGFYEYSAYLQPTFPNKLA